jgi:hypothetical protein
LLGGCVRVRVALLALPLLVRPLAIFDLLIDRS